MPERIHISRRHLLFASVVAIVNAPILLFLHKRRRNQAKAMVITIQSPFSEPTIPETVPSLTIAYRKLKELQESDPDIAVIRLAEFRRDNTLYDVGLYYTFSGNPSDREVQVTTTLLNKNGHVIAKQTRVESDARTIPGNDYFGFHMPGPRENTTVFYFKNVANIHETSSVRFEICNV